MRNGHPCARWPYKELLKRMVKWVDTWPDKKLHNTHTIRKHFKLPRLLIDYRDTLGGPGNYFKARDILAKQTELARVCSTLAAIDVIKKVEGDAYMDGRVHFYLKGPRQIIKRPAI